MVGDDGAHSVWLLVQDAAASDPVFQRRCLDLLAAAVEAGAAAPRELAYLTDRVLLAEGEPQEAGTEVTVRDGQYEPRNLAGLTGGRNRWSQSGVAPRPAR